jgi:2-octaprenyl-6-methoxyphenol hydroxylase
VSQLADEVFLMPDIVVVGGGLTGLMTALTLSHSPYQVVHIQRHQPIDGGETIRTTTVSAAGKRMLETLGVWQRLATPPTPIEALKVADGEATIGVRARHGKAFGLEWQDGDEPMAFVVPNAALLSALERQIQAAAVTPLIDRTVADFTIANNRANLSLVDDKGETDEVTCDLVVGCDGRNSTLRKSAGIRQHALPHKQTAVVALIAAERPHQNAAFQRFLGFGPIALMPMDDNLMSLVWTLPKQEALQYQACDVDAFNKACTKAFGDELGFLTLQSDRLVWPLQPTFIANPTADNLILAGDAAHVIHPLAGQGYNLALGDAAVLLDILCDTFARGLPAGHLSVLTDFRQKRRLEVGAMSLTTTGLNSLFSTMPTGVAKIAGLGMSLLNRSPAKSAFSTIARGGTLAPANLFAGRLPQGNRHRK